MMLMLFGIGALPAFAQTSGAGAGAKICGWFTPAEISKYLGAEVTPGEVGGPLDSLCQWNGKTASGAFIHIQLASPRSWAAPDLADGFKRVQGIGNSAYIVPEFGGWKAAARMPGKIIVVAGVGGTLTAERTLDLLRVAISRQ